MKQKILFSMVSMELLSGHPNRRLQLETLSFCTPITFLIPSTDLPLLLLKRSFLAQAVRPKIGPHSMAQESAMLPFLDFLVPV